MSLRPQWIAVFGFLAVILIGGSLLCLPVATRAGMPSLTVTDAFFTATSATCVTGLSVVDVGARLSTFGQIVLLSMIQIGGLGITAFSTFFLMLFGRRISMQNESILMDAFGVDESDGIHVLLMWTIGLTFFIELAGAAVLYHQYRFPDVATIDPYPPAKACYYAIFHAISAFCNAGFSLHPNSIIAFQRDPIYVGAISTLIVLGGIGFLVLFNLFRIKFWRRNLKIRGRMTLHTKLVLITSVILISLGAVLILLTEWNHSLVELPIPNKISCSILHSVSSRTAGYNVMEMSQITEQTRLLSSFLMLIGGSPGSSAGGIKTTTFVVLLATVVSMCKNRRETVVFSRTVPNSIVRESIVITVVAFLAVFCSYGILLYTEAPLNPGEASKLIFESISALATVGLSIDFTSSITIPGRWVLALTMFVGRLGPLTIAMLIGNREEAMHIRYPEEEIVVG